MTVRFDDSALHAPVDRALARREGRERVARNDRGVGVGIASVWVVFQAVVLVAGAGVLAALCVVAVQLLFGGDGLDATTIVLAALMVTPLAVAQVRSLVHRPRERETEEYRLSRFATANRMDYSTGELDPVRPAALFGTGTSRVASDILTASSPRAFEAAGYAFDTWAARARLPRAVTYVAFDLQTGLTPMTLVNTSKDLPGCPWKPAGTQRALELEAVEGFPFEVFCEPKDAETVRRQFSEDVQVALMDAAESADIEVVDGRVYAVTRRRLPMSEPAFWEWVEDLARLVDVLEGQRAGSVPDRRDPDAARRSRRSALFAAPRAGRTTAVGCLVPLLVGLAVAAVITLTVNG